MTKLRRVVNIIEALLIALCGYAIMENPKAGVAVVLVILGLTMIITGLKYLYYYVTMARFSVGGKIVLYTGAIILDLGVLSLNMTEIPELYMMLFLIVCYLFSGIIDVVRSFEALKYEAQSWRLNMLTGIICIVIAIVCIFSMQSVDLLTRFFGIGLIYRACMRFVQAFRKTAVVYIQ